MENVKLAYEDISKELEESGFGYSNQNGKMDHVFKRGGETVIVTADSIKGGYNVQYIGDDIGHA